MADGRTEDRGFHTAATQDRRASIHLLAQRIPPESPHSQTWMRGRVVSQRVPRRNQFTRERRLPPQLFTDDEKRGAHTLPVQFRRELARCCSIRPVVDGQPQRAPFRPETADQRPEPRAPRMQIESCKGITFYCKRSGDLANVPLVRGA